MSRFSLRALLVGAILLPVSVAVAGGDRLREMATAVGLSAEQTVQVEDIMEEYKLNQVDNKAAVLKARMELRSQMDAATLQTLREIATSDALFAIKTPAVQSAAVQSPVAAAPGDPS